MLSDQTILRDRLGWYNLGEWDLSLPEEPYVDAARRLALSVGQEAHLKEGGAVLDIGAGRGTSSAFWIETFGIGSVDIVEPSRRAERSLREMKVRQPKINRLYTVTVDQVNLGDVAYDAIVALDCAYHFHSAEVLPRLARNHLRAGGFLCFTTVTKPDDQRMPLACRLAGVREGSIMTEIRWQQLFQRFGLTQVTRKDLTTAVFSGFQRHITGMSQKPWHRPEWWKFYLTAKMLANLEVQGYRYILFSLRKPASYMTSEN